MTSHKIESFRYDRWLRAMAREADLIGRVADEIPINLGDFEPGESHWFVAFEYVNSLFIATDKKPARDLLDWVERAPGRTAAVVEQCKRFRRRHGLERSVG